MLKKFKVCDCFLDTASYCLHTNTDFNKFWKECLRLKGQNDIFTTEDTRRNSASLSPVTYIACCKKFVDFQIDLFVKTE